METETVVAASSAAAEAPKFTQFNAWDEDGTPVVSPKAESPKPAEAGKPEDAEAAAADTSKETKAEDAADSAANKKQDSRRKPDVESRFKKLTDDHKAELAKLQRELEEARKPKTDAKAESSTAKAEEKPATPPPTRPKPVNGELGPDGKRKHASYEDYVEDLTLWQAEQLFAKQQREQQANQQREGLSKHLEEARGRYTDFDSVTKPLIAEMLKPDIPREVFAVINDSPVLADLLYTLGGTEATKADFLDVCRTNPGKALRVALLMEQEIAKELGKGKAGEKKAGEGEAAPAVNKPRAPKPPTEVGGRGAPGEDALISAAKAGDFRTFEAEQTRRALASRK